MKEMSTQNPLFQFRCSDSIFDADVLKILHEVLNMKKLNVKSIA